MSDSIADIIWNEFEVYPAADKEITEYVAKLIRQQIGREILTFETSASFADKTYYDGCKEWEQIVREICQMEVEE